MCGCSYMEKLCFLDRTSSLQTQFIKQVREGVCNTLMVVVVVVVVAAVVVLMMMTIIYFVMLVFAPPGQESGG